MVGVREKRAHFFLFFVKHESQSLFSLFFFLLWRETEREREMADIVFFPSSSWRQRFFSSLFFLTLVFDFFRSGVLSPPIIHHTRASRSPAPSLFHSLCPVSLKNLLNVTPDPAAGRRPRGRRRRRKRETGEEEERRGQHRRRH